MTLRNFFIFFNFFLFFALNAQSVAQSADQAVDQSIDPVSKETVVIPIEGEIAPGNYT